MRSVWPSPLIRRSGPYPASPRTSAIASRRGSSTMRTCPRRSSASLRRTCSAAGGSVRCPHHGSYNPSSYHCGTVWAVEQSTIAFGLRRFGFDDRALELTKAVFDLAQLYPDYRIPECVGGDARDQRPTPGAYPHANTPQLWNATVFPLLVHTMLGLQPLAPLETLVVAPDLPTWLPEVVLSDLRIGAATANVRFWRGQNGHSHAEIVEKKGTIRLIHQPPPES